MIPKAISMDLRQIALLLVFFIFYVIFGGTIFMYLESPHENTKRQELEEVLIEFREKIKKLNDPNITEENITGLIRKLIDAQNLNLFTVHSNKTNNWDFFNSFFFAITVTTTIGYGHLSPSTVFGRIFCIIYALFGIPVTGILLGGIGDRFSKCFLKNVSKVKNRYHRQLSVRLEMLKHGLLFFVPWFVVFLIVPACIFAFIERWTFLEGFYYCFVTLSTIGFGDYVAARFEGDYVWIYKISVVLWIVFGLAYLSMILNFISQGLRSRRLTNVVHSIRRMSATPISSKTNHLSKFRNKLTLNRQQSLPITYHSHHNGKVVKSDLSISSAESPPNTSSSATHSWHPSPNDSPCDTPSASTKPKENVFFDFIHSLPFLKNSSASHRKEITRYRKENNIKVKQPLRRINSLPDIKNCAITIDSDNDQTAFISDNNDNELSLTKHSVISMPIERSSASQTDVNARPNLIDRRKSFFNELDDNASLQVTSV